MKPHSNHNLLNGEQRNTPGVVHYVELPIAYVSISHYVLVILDTKIIPFVTMSIGLLNIRKGYFYKSDTIEGHHKVMLIVDS